VVKREKEEFQHPQRRESAVPQVVYGGQGPTKPKPSGRGWPDCTACRFLTDTAQTGGGDRKGAKRDREVTEWSKEEITQKKKDLYLKVAGREDRGKAQCRVERVQDRKRGKKEMVKIRGRDT